MNRIDDIIVFNPLTKDNLRQIVDIQLRRLGSQIEGRGLHLEITTAAKDVLLAQGYDAEYGARPMRRTIQRLIQDPLSLKLLEGEYLTGDTVLVDAEDNNLVFGKRPAPPEVPETPPSDAAQPEESGDLEPSHALA